MSIQCDLVIKQLERIAPPILAEDWDNVGLQVGDRGQMVSKIMVALNADLQVVHAAKAQGVDLLITHHPLIFKPIKRVIAQDGAGQVITSLIQAGIGLYVAHTNLDIVSGGVNDVLAQALELEEVKVLSQTVEEKHYKLVVYVPVGYEDSLRQALCEAGAGWIGHYGGCTFGTTGIGTFLPNEGTNPFLGKVGQWHHGPEVRLETVVPAQNLQQVLEAMVHIHPYEEVAYDLFRLENAGFEQGIGRIGRLPKAVIMADFLKLVCEKLGLVHLNYHGDLTTVVQTVALCGGSGASYLSKAKACGADVYLTGDVKYHDGQLAKELGLMVVDGGHFATEHLMVPILADYLVKVLEGHGVEVVPYLEEKDFMAVYAHKEN